MLHAAAAAAAADRFRAATARMEMSKRIAAQTRRNGEWRWVGGAILRLLPSTERTARCSAHSTSYREGE